MLLKTRNSFKIPWIQRKILVLLFCPHNGQDCFNIKKCDPMLMTKVFLKIDASDKGHFEDFPKEKDESSLCHALLWSYFLFHVMLCFGHALLHFVMLLLTKSAPNTKIFSSTIDSPHFGDKKRNLLFTCHYSLSLFICYCS